MDDYTREMMDLKTLVTRTLEKKGVLAKIRAELRSSVFEAIEEEDRATVEEDGVAPALLGSCNDRAKQLHASPSGRLLTALICEYLDWAQLGHTLKVYLPECNLQKDFWKAELKDFSSKNGYDLNRNGESGPLLLDVLEGFLKFEATHGDSLRSWEDLWYGDSWRFFEILGRPLDKFPPVDPLIRKGAQFPIGVLLYGGTEETMGHLHFPSLEPCRHTFFFSALNLSQARVTGRRLITPETESSSLESRNIRRPSSSSVAGGLPPLGRTIPVSQASDRRMGSSIPGYRKDEYAWRYDSDELSEEVIRAASALENLQLDRKTRNLTSSWRHSENETSDDDGKADHI